MHVTSLATDSTLLSLTVQGPSILVTVQSEQEMHSTGSFITDALNWRQVRGGNPGDKI